MRRKARQKRNRVDWVKIPPLFLFSIVFERVLYEFYLKRIILNTVLCFKIRFGFLYQIIGLNREAKLFKLKKKM